MTLAALFDTSAEGIRVSLFCGAVGAGASLAFFAGVFVGRFVLRREPPLREAPRPAEACVEEWAT